MGACPHIESLVEYAYRASSHFQLNFALWWLQFVPHSLRGFARSEQKSPRQYLCHHLTCLLNSMPLPTCIVRHIAQILPSLCDILSVNRELTVSVHSEFAVMVRDGRLQDGP